MTAMPVYDIHTHCRTAPDCESVLCIGTDIDLAVPGGLYSAGIHPWDLERDGFYGRLQALERLAGMENVVAIGECGLDSLRGPDIAFQKEAFMEQAATAARVHKPMILHVVRQFDTLISLRKQSGSSERWLIHGFRGGVRQMEQLLDNGFYLSFGIGSKPETLAAVPDYSLILETDGKCPVHAVQELAASARCCNVQAIRDASVRAACDFLGLH